MPNASTTFLDSSKINVIFLDIGGVLLTNGWGHESRQKAAEVFGIDYNELDTLHHFIYNVFEMGKISLNDYLDTVIFNHPRDFSRKEFKDFMYGESQELPTLLAWLKDWKKKCDFRIFSINNESREVNDFRIEKFDLRKAFDGFFTSCHVGMRKPDPGIFNIALDIAQVKPENSVYFDDRLMLVNAAGKLGINSFHHQTAEKTISILENLKK